MTGAPEAAGTGTEKSKLLWDLDGGKGPQGADVDKLEESGVFSLGPARPDTCSRGIVLAVLVVIFTANQACRILPFYLVNFGLQAEPTGAMNAALRFGPGRYGVFATMGFTVPFTLGSLLAGVLADMTDRMRMLGLACIVWSLCTMCMAGAMTYPFLLGLRGLLGLSQSLTNPAALSLIADLFPEERATMCSVFGLGIYFGSGTAALGAALDERVGWRSSCTIFGLASMALSLLTVIPGDPRPQPDGLCGGQRVDKDTQEGGKQPGPSKIAGGLRQGFDSVLAGLGAVLSRGAEATSSKAVRLILFASTLRFCAGFSILVWLPSAVRVHFPARIGQFSVLNSAFKALVGASSSLAGGVISDALRKHGFGDRASALFCAASSLVSAPLWYMVLSTELPFSICMGVLLAQYLAAESWLGPAVATLQGAVPAESRGAAQGVFTALTALGNAMPAGLGMLDSESLVRGLRVSVTLCYVLSAAGFCMAAFSLQRQPPPKPPGPEAERHA